MAKGKPNAAQAQLHLQVFDLRREQKMREARDWFIQKYHPAAPADMLRRAPPARRKTPPCAWC